MDKELAKHVVTVGLYSLSLLESLIPLLKEHCDDAEYQDYLKSIGAISAKVGDELFNRIFDEYPDLEKEVEQQLISMDAIYKHRNCLTFIEYFWLELIL